jgi:monovalent cation:H+ antiporter-2, CPA2 family
MGGIDLIQDLGLVMLVAAAAAWLCQGIGLPVVIGYLGAGVLISPHTHSFGFVSDVDRIHALVQVGLVFLFFNIGQGLSLQRLKRIRLSLILATLLVAILVLVGCRWLGTILGWPAEHSLVLAAILLVSSTTVLRRNLRDARQTNTTFGQTALTVTALDDLVAVVMLTMLTSIIYTGGTDAGAMLGTIFRLKAVIVAMLIGALLLIPPLLNRVTRASTEVGALLIAGILLSMALLSAKVGFSAALGAFLLGMIVSTTGKHDQVDRALGTLCDVFGPVFFLGLGMLLNLHALFDAWPLVVGVLALVLVLRIVATAIALLIVGHPVADASRAAICLAPIGEFSLILALTGVRGGIVPESFYAVAVGVCLFTAVTTPLLIRRSRSISNWLEAHQPQAFTQLIGLYHEWIESLKQGQNASLLWRLTAPRVLQLGVLVLLISGLLAFASPFYFWTEKWLGSERQLGGAFSLLFWSLFLTLIIAPLVAIWRQVEALAMICAEAATKSRPRRTLLRPIFERLLRAAILSGIVVWFATFVPYEALSTASLLAIISVGAIIAAISWRRLIRLHSRFEIELRAHLSESPFASDKPQLPGWPKRNGHWRMRLAEVVLNETGTAPGKRIADLPLRSEFGCTIVHIDRQGIIMPNPGADSILFPNDKLLLLGTEDNLQSAELWLRKPREEGQITERPGVSDLSLGHLMVPTTWRHVGKSIAELGIRSQFGIQIVGIERGNDSLLSPGPREHLASGDQLLVLGTPLQVSDMAVWLSN